MSQHIQSQEGVASAASDIQPRWLRIPAAVKYGGISRSRLYQELARGTIRSASLRGKHQTRGARIVDRLSLDAFLEAHICDTHIETPSDQ